MTNHSHLPGTTYLFRTPISPRPHGTLSGYRTSEVPFGIDYRFLEFENCLELLSMSETISLTVLLKQETIVIFVFLRVFEVSHRDSVSVDTDRLVGRILLTVSRSDIVASNCSPGPTSRPTVGVPTYTFCRETHPTFHGLFTRLFSERTFPSIPEFR